MKNLLFCLLALALLPACTLTRQLASPYLGRHLTPLPTPETATGQRAAATWLSGGIATGHTFNQGDSLAALNRNRHLELGLHRGWGRGRHRLAAGLTGWAGQARLHSWIGPDSLAGEQVLNARRRYHGLTLRAAYAYAFRRPAAVGLLWKGGLQVSYSHEAGDFLALRQQLPQRIGYSRTPFLPVAEARLVYRQPGGGTYGLTHEIGYRWPGGLAFSYLLAYSRPVQAFGPGVRAPLVGIPVAGIRSLWGHSLTLQKGRWQAYLTAACLFRFNIVQGGLQVRMGR